MVEMGRKHVCGNLRCNWCGDSDDVLRAPNPFEEGELWACPECKTVNELYLACDVEECCEMVTCGTPTKEGYRSTCSKHRPDK